MPESDAGARLQSPGIATPTVLFSVSPSLPPSCWSSKSGDAAQAGLHQVRAGGQERVDNCVSVTRQGGDAVHGSLLRLQGATHSTHPATAAPCACRTTGVNSPGNPFPCPPLLRSPPPFSARHNSYIQRYISTHDPHAVGMPRSAAAVTKDRTIVPVDLALAHVSGTGDDSIFVGAVKRTAPLDDCTIRVRVVPRWRSGRGCIGKGASRCCSVAWSVPLQQQGPVAELGVVGERLDCQRMSRAPSIAHVHRPRCRR